MIRSLFPALLLLACVACPLRAATLLASGGGRFPVTTESALWEIDPITGAPTLGPGLSTNIPPYGGLNSIYNGAIAYDPFNDRLFALGCDTYADTYLYEVNRVTGDLTVIGSPVSYPASLCSGGLTFDVTTRKLFAVGGTGTQASGLWEIDAATGAGLFIGYSGVPGRNVTSIGCDPQSGVLYGNGHRDFSVPPDGAYSALMTLDKSSGAATFIGYHGVNLGRQLCYGGLAFDPVTNVMYSIGSVSASQQGLYIVDKSTGVATLQGSPQVPGFGVDGGLVFVAPIATDVAAVIPRAVNFESHRGAAQETVFNFSLHQMAKVSIRVFDARGRRVEQIAAGRLEAGSQSVRWQHSIAAGAYFAALELDGTIVGKTKLFVAR